MVLNRLKVCFNAIMLISFLLIVGVFFAISAKAEEVNEERKDSVYQNLYVKPLKSFDYKGIFINFDVNENGDVIVAFENDRKDYIVVFDKNGVFKYGYQFHSYGGFAVEWIGENHNVILLREDLSVIMDSSANCVAIYEYTSFNNTNYRKLIESYKQVAGEDTFYYERYPWLIFDEGSIGRFRIIRQSPDGAEKIIYDAGYQKGIFKIVFLLLHNNSTVKILLWSGPSSFIVIYSIFTSPCICNFSCNTVL